MFGPSKVSKSLIDAVSKIMEDKGVAETNEPTQLDEAEKVATPTGMKVYGSRYGNSQKARKDQTKHDVDTLKGPKDKEMKEDLGAQADSCVDATQAKKIADKEANKAVNKHNKQLHQGQVQKEGEEVKSFKDRLLEREMTSAETKKREKIVMKMKDKQEYFKKKYGKRWKDVMYATATKTAMGEELVYEEETELDEAGSYTTKRDASGKVTSGAVDQFKAAGGKVDNTPTKVNFPKGKKSVSTERNPDGSIKKSVSSYFSKEETELDESFADEHGIGRDIADKKQKMATASNTGKGKPLHNVAKGFKAFIQGKPEPKESVELDGEVLEAVTTSGVVKPKEKTVDMLRGRVKVPADYDDATEHKSSKIKLAQEETKEKESFGSTKQTDTKARKSIEAHEGRPEHEDNLDAKHGKPNSFDVHTEAKDPETSDAWGGQANFVTNKGVAEKTIAGTPGWEKVKGADTKGNVKDKSGATHTPMSRAKDLARQAFKKVKTEMLGKAPGNN